MRRRRYDFATITEFPEVADELPTLLSELGSITRIQYELSDAWVTVTLRLHKPAQVWNSLPASPIAVMSINRANNACLGTRVPIRMRELPKRGDKLVCFTIRLELDSRDVPENDHTIERMRSFIRDFAHKAAQGWYYVPKPESGE